MSTATGAALGNKLDGRDSHVFVFVGDGECDEGQVWEAAQFAAHYKLDNLTVIVDNNGLQIDGSNDQVMSLGSIADKFKAFGFEVIEIDGNDMQAISDAFHTPVSGKPKCILAHTVKGKGVSFMENQAGWHGKAPNDEQYAQAMEDLEKVGEALCQK
mgnify:FL=1